MKKLILTFSVVCALGCGLAGPVLAGSTKGLSNQATDFPWIPYCDPGLLCIGK
ncbi:hypothetical protein AAIB41_05060 [Brucella sp. BE17]|uniref:hypothetical protein n=1 Tax=Brucella sp. BE17 TaxID=3142977 RepID=UPI0031BA3FDD